MSDQAHTDNVSILILAEVYGRYPIPVSVKDLAEGLNKSQRSHQCQDFEDGGKKHAHQGRQWKERNNGTGLCL